MPRVFDFIAGGLVASFIFVFVSDVFLDNYEMNPLAYTMVTAIVGAYAGGKILLRGKDDQ